MDKKLEVKVQKWDKPKDILKHWTDIEAKAFEGRIIFIRKDTDYILLARPEINGIYKVSIDKDGYIKSIVLF